MSSLIRRSSITYLAAVIASLGLANAALAAPPGQRYVAKKQVVVIDGLSYFFCASVLVRGNQADGFVSLQSTSHPQEVLDLVAAATGDLYGASSANPTVPLILLPPLNRPARPADFVRATVSPIADEPDHDLWDFVGSTIEAGPPARLTFVAEGRWSPSKDHCEPLDFGQLDVRAALAAPRQRVQPLDGSDPFEFEALVCIDRENAAAGYIDVPLGSSNSLHNVFFGAVLRSPDTGVVFVTASFAAEGSTLEDLLWMVSTPIASDDESYDAVDFQNMFLAKVPPTTVQFEAETYSKLSGRRSR